MKAHLRPRRKVAGFATDLFLKFASTKRAQAVRISVLLGIGYDREAKVIPWQKEFTDSAQSAVDLDQQPYHWTTKVACTMLVLSALKTQEQPRPIA